MVAAPKPSQSALHLTSPRVSLSLAGFDPGAMEVDNYYSRTFLVAERCGGNDQFFRHVTRER